MENEQTIIGFGEIRFAVLIEFREIEEEKFHVKFILLMDNLNGVEFDLDLNRDSTVTGEHHLVEGALVVKEGIPEA